MNETLSQLRARIEGNPRLSDDERRQLLDLIGSLEHESSPLRGHPELPAVERALASVGAALPGEAPVAETEAEPEANEEPDNLLDRVTDDFQESVRRFEASHPDLANALSKLGYILARMGI